jgi:uncharacterized YccA/Bax inhibitor family protein
VLTRLGDAARHERTASPDYDLGGYQVQHPYYQTPQVHTAMTLDDVVVRTVALLAVTGIAGALSWLLIPNGPMVAVAMIGSSLAALVLGLVISFARVTNPVPIVGYAVLEGVLLGVVSRWFESRYDGIVIQAVVGTFGVFAAMAGLYKARVLRATPKFTRFVLGALIGIVLLSLVNFASAAFGHNLGLIEYGVDGKVGWLPIVFSLAAIAIGALTFILDFDAVEQGTRMALPVRYSWYCAFGLLVGLIFLYWQILRLLGYARR